MGRRPGSKTAARVRVFEGERARWRSDQLATEEPLEIRLQANGAILSLAVTMRTPGADFELAAGFLYGEGVVRDREEIRRIAYCLAGDARAEQRYNVLTVELATHDLPDARRLERHFCVSSACGVCGRTGLAALELGGCSVLPPGPEVSARTVAALPERLRAAQGVFDATGGLHAAGLFSTEGELLCVREDVGRHNAVDKLVGWALLEGRTLNAGVLLVSGRSSFEILQKAAVAGIPIVCAVSAPSSLAVELARRFGITLIGFLRGERFNVYSGEERVR
jgi:FdhD protein